MDSGYFADICLDARYRSGLLERALTSMFQYSRPETERKRTVAVAAVITISSKRRKLKSGIHSRRKYIEPWSEQEVSAMDISKRTRNCVLSISETSELNATTDADLIVAAPISYALVNKEWVTRDSLPMLTVKSLKKITLNGSSRYVAIRENHFATTFVISWSNKIRAPLLFLNLNRHDATSFIRKPLKKIFLHAEKNIRPFNVVFKKLLFKIIFKRYSWEFMRYLFYKIWLHNYPILRTHQRTLELICSPVFSSEKEKKERTANLFERSGSESASWRIESSDREP